MGGGVGNLARSEKREARSGARRVDRSAGPRFSLHYQPISDLDPVAIEKDVRRVLAAQPTIVVAPTGDSARAVVKVITDDVVVLDDLGKALNERQARRP